MSRILLNTERLTLRPVSENDLEAVHELLSLTEADLYNITGIPENTAATRLILQELTDGNFEFAILDTAPRY